MKRSKRLALLLGIFAVVCLATIVVSRMEENKEQIKASGEVVLAIDSDQVTALAWSYEETDLAFHKEEGTWQYDDDAAFPVSEEKIQELLGSFASFGTSVVIEDVTDYGMYGLDDPACTITVTTEAETYEILLGDYSTMDEERYVSIGDGNVYLAKADPMDQFSLTLRDMIENDEALDYTGIQRIRLTGAENYTITYDEDSTASYCPEDVYFTQGQPLDTERVESWLSNLTDLSLTNYVTYAATEKELADFGLDDPELTISVDYLAEDEDGQEVADTYVLRFSRDQEKLAAAQAAGEDEDREEVIGYVRVGDSPIVYAVTEETGESLLAVSYDDLRHRELMTADFDDVTQIDITLDGAAYTLTAGEEDEDGERVWTYQEEEVEIRDLQTALEDLAVDSTEDFRSGGSAGQEEIRLTLHLDNANHPQVELLLCRYDGSDCLATLDGKTFGLISRSAVVDVIEAVHAIVLN